MSRSAGVFFAFVAIFAGTVKGVGSESTTAIATGYVLLVAQFAWSFSTRANSDSDESPDATYFLGFVMTLVYLAVGLHRSATGKSALSDTAMVGFISDLAVGLSYTIVGLTLRQVSILSLKTKPVQTPLEVSLGALTETATALREIGSTLTSVSGGLTSLLGDTGPKDSEPVVSRLQKIVDQFHDRVAHATEGLSETVGNFETAADNASGTLLRSSSSLGDEFLKISEALQLEMKSLFTEVHDQRASLGRLAQLVARQLNTQLVDWQTELSGMKSKFEGIRAAADEESKRAIASIGVSSTALTGLASSVVETVNQLPSPAKHLSDVWENLASREAMLTDAVGKLQTAITTLETLTLRASRATGDVSTSLEKGAAQLSVSGGQLNSALAEEAKRIREIMDELFAILDSRIGKLGR